MEELEHPIDSNWLGIRFIVVISVDGVVFSFVFEGACKGRQVGAVASSITEVVMDVNIG
jgi:predicted regulator of Ras-like GTPase activity (Roadblock/LC7/MglB family)